MLSSRTFRPSRAPRSRLHVTACSHLDCSQLQANADVLATAPKILQGRFLISFRIDWLQCLWSKPGFARDPNPTERTIQKPQFQRSKCA
ncbi:hypothetical protein BC936DRAFT_145389 [Jimgerdemannia flammicorona]|uniref:Uncharacterized protein n=1 Tax=Jimgerdemannia flammicorona TaxID=994334 RepID=A0A433DLU4_9FUNG|nr:hypothetical protein BC936DRAFT_145389 [Jimgerdemannia flammicorona]